MTTNLPPRPLDPGPAANGSAHAPAPADFAALAHELRTPLTLVLGHAEQLLAALATDDPRRLSASTLMQHARLLHERVETLLESAHGDVVPPPQLRATDVAALLREVGNACAPAASGRGLMLLVDAPDTLLAGVDGAQLLRVLQLLLGNAFKFVPRGGTVHCALRSDGDWLQLRIADSGPGIAVARRETVFVRSAHVPAGASAGVGLGLGLPTAHALVAGHGGTLVATDSEYGGACLELRLPRRAPASGVVPITAFEFDGRAFPVPAEQGAAMRPGPRALGQPRPRVLVVDDSTDMQRYVAHCLAAEFDVQAAADGAQGYQLALAAPPDLIVSDVMMPVLGGEQLVALLRAQPTMNETPILLLSAGADAGVRVRLLEQGAQDFIGKPFAARELLARARNLVAVRQSRLALLRAEEAKRATIEATNRTLQTRLGELRALFELAPGFVCVLRGPEHVFELVNAAYVALVGRDDLVGRSVADALPEIRAQGFVELLDRVYASGEPHRGRDVEVRLQRACGAPLERRIVDFVYQPWHAADGRVAGIFVEGVDVSERRLAEEALQQAMQRHREEFARLALDLAQRIAPLRASPSDAASGDAIASLAQLVDALQATYAPLVTPGVDGLSATPAAS